MLIWFCLKSGCYLVNMSRLRYALSFSILVRSWNRLYKPDLSSDFHYCFYQSKECLYPLRQILHPSHQKLLFFYFTNIVGQFVSIKEFLPPFAPTLFIIPPKRHYPVYWIMRLECSWPGPDHIWMKDRD